MRYLTLNNEMRAGAVATSLYVPFRVNFYACRIRPAAIYDRPNLRDNIVKDQRPRQYWTNIKIYSLYYPVIYHISTQIGLSYNVCAENCSQILVEIFGRKSVSEGVVLR